MTTRILILALISLCMAWSGYAQDGSRTNVGDPPAAADTMVADRSLGLMAGGIPGGGSIPSASGNYLLGIYARHLYPGDLFGEIRASYGIAESRDLTARIIPLEYRLNFRLLPLISPGTAGDGGFSPYVFMGSGFLFHSTVASVPERDPRTGNLDGRLPASSLFELDNGLTPFFSLGAGFDVALDPSLTLNLTVGSTRPFHQIALSGTGYRNHYLDLSVGINVKLPSRQRVARPKPSRPAAPPPRQDREPQEDSLTVRGAAQDTLAGEAAPMPVVTYAVSECEFSVQAGGFLSYRNAVDMVDSLRVVTGAHPVIYYDSNRELYVVRSAPAGSPSDALALLERLRDRPAFGGAALYQGCGPGTAPPPLRFQVQMGAFSDSVNARKKEQALENQFNVNLQVQQAGDSGLFRVRGVSYPTLGEGREALRELKAMGMGDTLFLARGTPERPYTPRYSFLLQLQRHRELEEARRGLSDLQQQTGRTLEVWRYDGQGGYYVVGYRGDEWADLQAFRRELESQLPELDPVLYINEEN